MDTGLPISTFVTEILEHRAESSNLKQTKLNRLVTYVQLLPIMI